MGKKVHFSISCCTVVTSWQSEQQFNEANHNTYSPDIIFTLVHLVSFFTTWYSHKLILVRLFLKCWLRRLRIWEKNSGHISTLKSFLQSHCQHRCSIVTNTHCGFKKMLWHVVIYYLYIWCKLSSQGALCLISKDVSSPILNCLSNIQCGFAVVLNMHSFGTWVVVKREKNPSR